MNQSIIKFQSRNYGGAASTHSMARERQKSITGLTPKSRIGGVVLGSESSTKNSKARQGGDLGTKFYTARPATSVQRDDLMPPNEGSGGDVEIL